MGLGVGDGAKPFFLDSQKLLRSIASRQAFIDSVKMYDFDPVQATFTYQFINPKPEVLCR